MVKKLQLTYGINNKLFSAGEGRKSQSLAIFSCFFQSR